MKAADLQSLFQLATALNFGFGALTAFSEPIRTRVNKMIFSLDNKLCEAIAAHSGDDDLTRELFTSSKAYMATATEIGRTRNEFALFDSFRARIFFSIACLISLLSLEYCSGVTDDDVSLFALLFATLLNFAPVAGMFVFSYVFYRCQNVIEPLIRRQIRKLEMISAQRGVT